MNMKKSLVYICLLGATQGVFGAAADYMVPDSYAGQKIRPGSIYDLLNRDYSLSPEVQTKFNR